jgi:hypothetical protein
MPVPKFRTRLFSAFLGVKWLGGSQAEALRVDNRPRVTVSHQVFKKSNEINGECYGFGVGWFRS